MSLEKVMVNWAVDLPRAPFMSSYNKCTVNTPNLDQFYVIYTVFNVFSILEFINVVILMCVVGQFIYNFALLPFSSLKGVEDLMTLWFIVHQGCELEAPKQCFIPVKNSNIWFLICSESNQPNTLLLEKC